MKSLSSVASEYRGIWVEERGRKLIISSQEGSHVFFPLYDSLANQDLLADLQKSPPDVSSPGQST